MPAFKIFHRHFGNDAAGGHPSDASKDARLLNGSFAGRSSSDVSVPPPSSESVTPTSTRIVSGQKPEMPFISSPMAGSSNQVQLENNVRSRLHALFGSNASPNNLDSTGNGNGDIGIPRTKTVPVRLEEPTWEEKGKMKAVEVKDRDAIKVLIVTWNMGDSLPKGDLSVLFGDVPSYTSVPATETLPELSNEHSHPYHIVVVAGQECPTHSGVPRGFAGGLIRGVRGAHKKHKEERAKEGEKQKEEDKAPEETGKAEEAKDGSNEREEVEDSGEGTDTPRAKSDEGHKDKHKYQDRLFSPMLEGRDVDSSEGGNSSGVSPAPSLNRGHGTLLHRHVHQPTSKGWSTMLDDWFCGPSAQRTEPQPPSPKMGNNVLSPSDSSFLSAPQSLMQRSSSAPARPTPDTGEMTTAVPIPIRSPTPADLYPSSLSKSPGTMDHLRAPNGNLSKSPLSRSISSTGSSQSPDNGSDSSSSSSPSSDIALGSIPTCASPPQMSLPPSVAPIAIPQIGKQKQDSDESKARSPVNKEEYGGLQPSATEPLGKDRPSVVVTDEGRTYGGEKCYLHLIKERLMGMYLSVYVYKGCEHLIQGVDKDFVTAGLAGGRVGNKGGIGISLKLADHRFLFVNSHLAAHTARLNARLANIAKIKQELRLDNFLPKDDPRSVMEDLTDRYDTVFWCGDLNFRLDVSRLHAEWLVEHKKYSEALLWDQLQNTMKKGDSDENPFIGFQEHLIDFPPTFKYDVWRSVRATNREIRKNIKRRGTNSSRKGPSFNEQDANNPLRGELPHVPEDEDQDADDPTPTTSKATDEQGDLADAASIYSKMSNMKSDDDAHTLKSKKSFESSIWTANSVNGANATAGTDISDSESLMRQPIDASVYGSRHKALEVALKSKTKHLLSLVKMDGVFSGHHTPKHRKMSLRSNKSRLGGSGAGHGSPREFDATSRRTSLSSMASMRTANMSDSPGSPKLPDEADHEVARPLAVPGSPRSMRSVSNPQSNVPSPKRPHRPSNASSTRNITSPPRRGLGRIPSMMRTPSMRSGASRQKSGDGEMDEEDLDDDVDHREGVYDTSKKQRVPSWCDRVLWKAHVVPDPPDMPEESPIDETVQDDLRHHKPFNRLSQAFISFGGHLKMPVARSTTLEPSAADRVPLNRPLTTDIPARRRMRDPHSPISPLHTSPENSPDQFASRKLPLESGSVPEPRRRISFTPPKQKSRPQTLSRSGSAPHHPLLNQMTPQYSPSANPKITFDSVVSDTSGHTGTKRPRANSDSLHMPRVTEGVANITVLDSPPAADSEVVLAPPVKAKDRPERRLTLPRRISGSRRNSLISPTSSAQHIHPAPPPRKTSGGSLRMRSRTKTLDSQTSKSSTHMADMRHSIAHPSGHNRDSSGTHGSGGDDSNPFMKFMREIQTLPSWLQIHRGSVNPPQVPVTAASPERKKRHQQGEVVCLHYGTIDDAGMRSLEGRSDHRPAIFSAAVYV